MGPSIDHKSVWALIRLQHGSISRAQLLAFGFTDDAIRHRVERGRLRILWPGVYFAGPLEATREALWMGAILAAGEGALLSHESAAALWGIHPALRRRPSVGIDPVQVSIPAGRRVRLEGVDAHRRRRMPAGTTERAIPLTQPLFTLAELATSVGERDLESAVNEADKLRLIEATAIARTLPHMPRTRNIARLERLLARQRRTDSSLERAFLRLVRAANLPQPDTQRRLNGHRVDFYWPEHRLVVEVDGSAYHRTPGQLTRDRRRDQAHLRAGLTPIRFTDLQIAEGPDEVVELLSLLTAPGTRPRR